MVLTKLIPALATVVLFGSGVATAALAEAPPTTPEPPTSTATTTTVTTSPTTTTEPATTTSTETDPPTNTEPATPAAETTTPAVPPSTNAPSPPRTVPHGANAPDTPTVGVRPAPSHPRKHRRRSEPLEITPPLGRGEYVFPVVGVSGYGDSYGAFRGDVRGKWHHGADIFAAVGAPVVAVANGTINRVGWHRLGGWRLWVRDAAANQFYYAHLSGYAPRVFHSRHVRAGDVLGFVGNTGDAYGGAPHLHFEVHPHQLLRLKYDGAVNPTTYLNSWQRVRAVHAPFPVHPRLPRNPELRKEARRVFRQLLVARHLTEGPVPTTEPSEADRSARRGAPSATRLVSSRAEPAMPSPISAHTNRVVPLLAGLLVIAVFVATPALATTLVWLRSAEHRSRAESD